MRKKNIILLCFGILLISFCKGSSGKAIEYNNFIATEIKLLADIESEMAIKDGPELDAAIEKFKKAVPEAIIKIKQHGKFEEEDGLQKAALDICNFYQEVIDGKWSAKGQEAIHVREEILDKQLQKAQSEFAAKFRFEIKK